MIYESVVTTQNAAGEVHIAPMGIRRQNGLFRISPFSPSTTLDNLRESGEAVINHTDDVRIIAGCLTGRRNWPVCSSAKLATKRLENSLSHIEVQVEEERTDKQRPDFYCREVHSATHGAFKGFNRAQAAVLEAAILVSRLDMLPTEKIATEISYLCIAIEKTAGEQESEAWEWLMEAIKQHSQKETVEMQS